MVYSFKQADNIQAELRKIADYQIGEALGALEDGDMDRAATVHDVRKRCKKLRGLIRLVRPSFPDYKKENKAFKTIAHKFDDLRDAKVLQDTYDVLMDGFDEQIDRSAFSSIKRELTERRQSLSTDAEWESRRRKAHDLLEQARGRASDWKLQDGGWDALSGGLEKTYGRALAAMEAARDEPTGPTLHEWRKRTKYHWYHTRLLKRAAPHLLKPRAKLLHDLSDDLGNHHDLHVFGNRIEAEPESFGEKDTLAILRAMTNRRQTILEQRVFHEGQRLFADETEVLSERYGEFWTAWQAEERRVDAT